MRRLLTVVFLLLSMGAVIRGAATARPAPALASVWAVDDGEKIFRENLTSPLKSGGPGNSVWDGRTVKLFAAAMKWSPSR